MVPKAVPLEEEVVLREGSPDTFRAALLCLPPLEDVSGERLEFRRDRRTLVVGKLPRRSEHLREGLPVCTGVQPVEGAPCDGCLLCVAGDASGLRPDGLRQHFDVPLGVEGLRSDRRGRHRGHRRACDVGTVCFPCRGGRGQPGDVKARRGVLWQGEQSCRKHNRHQQHRQCDRVLHLAHS